MSWLFSRALVVEFLPAVSSGGGPSAPLNTTATPQAFLSRDRTTDAWSRFPSGMTCEPLTEDHGEAVLMSFLEAFPVRISVVQGGAQGLTEREAGSGERWQGSFAKYDPGMSSWRTHQCSLLGGFTEFSETWPKWGSMRSGACWERTMLVPTTRGKESGLLPTPMKNLWPTPTAHNAKECAAPSEHNRNTPTLSAQAGGKLNPTWVAWLMGWPLGWTDLNASAMDKYQQWRQLHSAPSEAEKIESNSA